MTNQIGGDVSQTEAVGQLSDHHQYVICQVAGVRYGFDVAKVVEIARVPTTTRIPMAPEAFLGLADLRGRMVPILDLCTLLGHPKTEPGEATRVIITHAGRPTGFLVDSIVEMLDVTASRIEPASCMGDLISTNLVEGVLKDQNGRQATQLLNAAMLIDPEMSTALEQAMQNRDDHAEAESGLDTSTIGKADTCELLTFMLNSEEYAFDIEGIEQIIRIPKTITKVPAADEHLLGMINLRGQVIPLVSLHRMLHLADSPVEECVRILVATLTTPLGRPRQVGLLVDRVGEVLRVASSDLNKGPEIIARDGGRHREIMTVLSLKNGARQLSVLDLAGLFHTPNELDAIIAHSEGMASQVVSRNTEKQTPTKAVNEAQLVVFYLDGWEHGIMLDLVQEITPVPKRVSRMPNTAGREVGMIDLRGTAVPVMDMRDSIQLAPMERNENQRILVFDVDGGLHGFIIDAVVEVLRIVRRQHSWDKRGGLNKGV
ncbi:MAG: chemotaxis protein CheW, partial [Leptospirillia bacterium]